MFIFFVHFDLIQHSADTISSDLAAVHYVWTLVSL